MSSPTRQLVVLGDSGVYGWGDREGGGWCERLRKTWMLLPSAPVVYPLGIRGDGLERVASRWHQEWQCRGELRRKLPDGVLLAVGLNDTARVGRIDGRPKLSADGFRFGVQQLLSDIKKFTNVMMVGITPVDEAVMPFADCLWYSNHDGAVYEAQIEEACLEVDVPFLSLHAAMLSEPDWLSWIEPDGIHLNEVGHHWIHSQLMTWKGLERWAGLERLTLPTPI